MSQERAHHKIEKATALLRAVTRVAYVDVPAGSGIGDENGEVPAQRDYFCLVEKDGASRCVATITAVDTKVLCLIPHDGSGMCGRCEYIDAAVDGQGPANALLLDLIVSTVPMTPMRRHERAVCADPAPFLCTPCKVRPRSDSERPMERLS